MSLIMVISNQDINITYELVEKVLSCPGSSVCSTLTWKPSDLPVLFSCPTSSSEPASFLVPCSRLTSALDPYSVLLHGGFIGS